MLALPPAGRRLVPLALGLSLAVLAGCGEKDNITTYTVPRTPADPGVPHGKKPPVAGVRQPGPLPITYTVPPGWKETGPREVSRMGITVRLFTAFDVDQGKKAEATVQVFPVLFGDWAMNVNRWRREVGLGEMSAADAARAKERTTTAAGVASPYLDLAGPDKRSLVVVLTRGKQTWFFKLLGAKDVVADNKAKFESFVQSVKFTGAADE